MGDYAHAAKLLDEATQRAEAAEARVRELEARVAKQARHLKQALDQWQIYAECEPERDLANDLDAEATLYQQARQALSGSSELAQLRQAVVDAAMACQGEWHSAGLPYALEIALVNACDNLAALRKEND